MGDDKKFLKFAFKEVELEQKEDSDDRQDYQHKYGKADVKNAGPKNDSQRQKNICQKAVTFSATLMLDH